MKESRTLRNLNSFNDALNKAEARAVTAIAKNQKKVSAKEAEEIRKRLFSL